MLQSINSQPENDTHPGPDPPPMSPQNNPNTSINNSINNNITIPSTPNSSLPLGLPSGVPSGLPELTPSAASPPHLPSVTSPPLVPLASPSHNHPTVNNTPRSHVDPISVVDLDDPAPHIPPDFLMQQSMLKEQHLNDIKNQCLLLIHELDSNVDPEAVVKKHISQLKKYNELKDIALGLVTMIADQRQLRTTDILEEMKCELADD